ncbi:MAG: sigma-70 family RNA polymerase sigma factor [Acidobacteriota bacterium]
MESPMDVRLKPLVEQAYCSALACHGDLDLEPEQYTSHVLSVARKHLGSSVSHATAFAFINTLHTNDLYLSVACAKPSDVAWERFIVLYRAFIEKAASTVASTDDAAHAIADRITGHIFLPNGSGRSRIGSYEGRSSLATWLSAVINNAAIKEQNRCNRLEQLEGSHDVVDYALPRTVDAALRARTYASLVLDSLAVAGESLSEQERFILALRYEDDLQGYEIAAILGIHPSTVTRRLQRVYDKLRAKTISNLESEHQLSQFAIEECVDDIRENPGYSVLSFLRTST